jgi:hypothetical protein
MNFENLSDLGENQTFVRDNSKYGNNASTVINATLISGGGKYGNAYYFNRSLLSDGVYIHPAGQYRLANTSLTTWIKKDSTGHWVGIFARCQIDWYFGMNPSNQLIVSWGNASGQQKTCTPLTVTDTNWHFVGFTTSVNDSGFVNVTIYRDGVGSSCTSNEGMSSAYRTMFIGSMNSSCSVSGGSVFNGTIDELMVWNRTLSADEINQTYYAGLYRLSNTSWEFYTNKTNLTRGAYTYQGIVKDGAGTQNQTEWRTLRVNYLPTVTLVTPTIWNQTTNRTPSFTWTSNDPDSDSMTYELNLTCYVTTGGGCSGKGSDERYVQSISGTTYNLVGDLQYLIDYNNYYNWSMRANDGQEFGAWTNMFGLNISALIAISLPVDKIDFGLLSQGQSKNTTTNDPAPFRIQNDGNSLANITINGTNLWLTKPNPDRFYQFKIANNSAENGSFSWSQSIINFRNMSGPAATLLGIVELNYTDATDTAHIDLLVEDPTSEPAGARESTVTFTASLGE